MDEDIKEIDEQLGFLLTQVSLLKQRLTNAALSRIGITHVQFIILAGTHELSREGGIVTQQDIATVRRLDKAMVSNVVKSLVEKGYLLRQKHPVDRRAFTLLLTEEGIRKVLRGKQIVRQLDAEFFAGANKNELLETFTRLLRNDDNKNE